jgi:hypothetical protein
MGERRHTGIRQVDDAWWAPIPSRDPTDRTDDLDWGAAVQPAIAARTAHPANREFYRLFQRS